MNSRQPWNLPAMDLHLAATRFSERILRIFARDLPSDLQPWGDAMVAELPSVEGVVRPVLWALGGSMFLSKALFFRSITGLRTRGSEPTGAPPPSPLQRAAFVAVLLSIAMLLSPVFREGLGTALESWNPSWAWVSPDRSVPVANLRGDENDAASLAFAALHSKDLDKSVHLAERAVEKDPQYTWIFASLALWRNNILYEGKEAALQPPDGWIAKLVQWDPDNAVPHFLAAQADLRTTTEKREVYPVIPTLLSAEKLKQHPTWMAEMGKAFAAPRYDSYFARRMRLEREIFVRTGVRNPTPVVDGIFRHNLPSWWDINQYSAILLTEGDEASAAGHYELAETSYSTAFHFAERMHNQSQTSYERWYGSWPQWKAEAKLLALYQEWPRPEAAQRSQQILAQLDRQRDRSHTFNSTWELIFSRITTLGFVVSLSSGLAVLAMIGTLLGIGYFFTRRWMNIQASPRWNAMMDGAGKYGPFVMFASCLSLYFSYRPYAQTFHDYMYGAGGNQNAEVLRVFLELRFLPSFLADGLSHIAPLNVLGWYVVIGLLGLVVLAIVWRWVRSAMKLVTSAG